MSRLEVTVADGHDITGQQLQVLRHLANGMTYEQIARRMFIGYSTVRDHATRMYGRLGVHNAAHAVAVGYQRGLLRLPDVPCGSTAGAYGTCSRAAERPGFDPLPEEVPGGRA